jgi:hypothetical protein
MVFLLIGAFCAILAEYESHEDSPHPPNPGRDLRTTAEVLLALLPDWHFSREPDAQTGHDELAVRV